MILFWVVAVVLAVLALVLVLRPLLFSGSAVGIERKTANISIYKDQLRELDADRAVGTLADADYQSARTELEARLLEDAVPEAAPTRSASRALLVTVALAVPLCGAALYAVVGTPGAIGPRENPHVFDEQQLTALVERLAARMRENPDDPEGWKLLGRSYVALGKFPEAFDAYTKAALRKPRDAELLADMADVLATMRPTRLQGEPEKLVLRALEIDPRNLKALALAGTAAFDRKDFDGAVRHWSRMLPMVEPGSEDARQIQASINEARSLSGAALRTLNGKVSISKKLAAQANPDDIVFIFARAAGGPPMPLAVKRVRVRDLPLEFSLDDSMAMAPGLTLSAHPRVVVGARVSKSGTPTAQPGDLQGISAPVANDARGVSVTIDSVVR